MEIAATTVVGAGVMGSQIAQVLAVAGLPVRLHDAHGPALDAARARIREGRFGLQRAVARGLLTEAEAGDAEDRVAVCPDLDEALAGTDVVIEAVPEDLGLKVRVFRDVDRRTAGRVVLASNTAGFPIAALAEATDHPERVVGWHWSQPTAVMRLAEIVVHPRTDPAVVDAVSCLARRCGKNPVVVHDQPLAWGFVANRINAAVRREADSIVAEGVATPEQVDQIMKDAFRWPMGPFEMREQRGLG